MTTAGATAAAVAAAAAARTRRLLVGGMLLEVEPEDFEALARENEGLVVTGVTGIFRKRRLYFAPIGGLTFFCRMRPDQWLGIQALEVKRIDTGGLI